METLPMLGYLREVLDEHTLPLEGSNASLVEAMWLIDMIEELEAGYKSDGLL